MYGSSGTFRGVYGLAIHLLMLFWLPAACFQMIFKGKYRDSFKERFGFQIPKVVKTSKRLIWIHAVSVGETKAVAPLVKRMKEDDPSVQFIVTSGTETGHMIAKQMIPFADAHHFLPPDFGWIIKRMMQAAKPDLLLVSETDYWYHFFYYAKRYGASIVMVNGKISHKSTERFSKFQLYSKRLFGLVDWFFVQNCVYQNRFQRIGIHQDQILVTGNMKFDGIYPKYSSEEACSWKKKMGISDQPVLVIGSSHAPEEETILNQIENIWGKFPNLKVLIVPRHPERFDEVALLLERKKIRFSRYTQEQIDPMSQVVLVDAMGVLRTCYQFADLAIVAGSYVEHVGGHNIVEPSAYGVPVIFGPHMHSQPELVDLVLHYEAGYQVRLDQLEQRISKLLSDRPLCEKIGKNGLRLIEDNKGAVEKTWEFLKGNILG